ncbi:MAG: M1 family metallopeptidase [Flavobacteriaceae bacterium]|nr:M1 family metallopeptidase [Flavobacteriaceae bacterium]
MKKFVFVFMVFSMTFLGAQSDWQQKVDYKMNIRMDVNKFGYDADMVFTYYNNSPDVLNKIYFHLYYNAFQPGSAMDERLKNIPDPDPRMTKNLGTKENPVFESRIAKLTPEDIGYQKVNKITQNGQILKTQVRGTILEVELAQALNPGAPAVLHMEWEAQIPQIIRRGGKNTNEGIAFSMTQWYPKAAQYDQEGWHLDEYIAREFYAPFGDFDVKITMPSTYIVGASGKLSNENAMPGYSNTKFKKNSSTTWHFAAKNIHDFAWAADEKFKVDKTNSAHGPTIYYVYDKNLDKEFLDNWQKVQPLTAQFFDFMSERFGTYPWETYTVVQGGDGGMEYGTSTLVTGKRKFESLLGVIYHEVAHSWFQHLFAIDETRDEWMDEGFTTYAEAAAMHHIMGANKDKINPFQDAYDGYYFLVASGNEEPLSLHADYFNYNQAYGLSAYYKGQVYVAQLGYIIGEEKLAETFLKFYDSWKFKHPKPADFQKIAQDVSGINLKWYNNLFINTVRYIDYGVKSVSGNKITLENASNFPMPLDVLVTYTDGSKQLYYIPLNEMRGEKDHENQFYNGIGQTLLTAWDWTTPEYSFEAAKPVQIVEIDYTQRLADVNRTNNVFPSSKP